MKKVYRVSVQVLLMALILVSITEARTNGWEERFFKANQSYKEGCFEDAGKGFSDLIQSGHQNGHLYYNLGNVFFKQGRIGHAILNYERARILIPRDADLDFNLRYAHNHIRDDIRNPEGFLSKAFFWLDSFNLCELFRGFALLNILLFSIFIVRLFLKAEWIF